MKSLKKASLILVKSIGYFALFLLVYVISAYSLSKITVNTNVKPIKNEVTIYIKSNGVHTDIVVPTKNEFKDWSTQIKYSNTKANDSIAPYLAIGWGDKGFYLNTPEWSDLKVSTALTAATGIGSTAMHATFYKQIKENKNCVKIKIDSEDYKRLITYIENDFQQDNSNNFQYIQATTYGNTDAFYEANGSYSLFYTCNTWANNALKAANQKAAFWTVTDTGILCHYQ